MQFNAFLNMLTSQLWTQVIKSVFSLHSHYLSALKSLKQAHVSPKSKSKSTENRHWNSAPSSSELAPASKALGLGHAYQQANMSFGKFSQPLGDPAPPTSMLKTTSGYPELCSHPCQELTSLTSGQKTPHKAGLGNKGLVIWTQALRTMDISTNWPTPVTAPQPPQPETLVPGFTHQ